MTNTTFGRRLRTVLLSFAALGTLAAVAAPAVQAAPGDPDLQITAPTNVQFGYFDDHSVTGDAHPHWDVGAGDPKWTNRTEPFLLTFSSSVTSAGAPLTLCGVKQPGDAQPAHQWMLNYQALGGADCSAPGSPSTPPVAWSKYVVSNHHQQDRWQLMDFQRFALVRAAAVPATPTLPPATTPGSASDPLKYAAFDPSCADSIFLAPLPGTTSPQLHCWNPPGGDAVPAVSVPSDPAITAYGGAYWDTRWGSCLGWFAHEDPAQPANYCGKDSESPGNTPLSRANWTIAAGQTRGTEIDYRAEPTTQAIAFDAVRDVPNITSGTYYLVSWVNPYGNLREATTANNITCTALNISVDPPTAADGYLPFHVTQLPTSQQPARCPWSTTANVAAAPSTVKPTLAGGATGSLPRLTTKKARSYAKSALAKAFGKLPKKGVSVSCKTKSKTAATCAIRYRTSSRSYRGTVKIQVRRVGVAGVWRYALDVRRTRNGKTTRIKRGYKTGGTIKIAK